MDKIRNLFIFLPSKLEIEQLAQNFEGQDKLIIKEKGTLAKLYLLKQGLMQDLLSGRVAVEPYYVKPNSINFLIRNG